MQKNVWRISRQGEEHWVVIDPKGIIDDIHFDTIQYLLNYVDRGGDCEQVLRDRIAIIADRLGLDPRRIAMWHEACLNLSGRLKTEGRIGTEASK